LKALRALYSNDKTQTIDHLAAKALAIDSFQLMKLAGEAVYQHLQSYKNLLVVTGPGNNGGDGFVIAELARQAQQKVTVLCLSDPKSLKGDALLAAQQYQGDCVYEWPQCACDCVVDAIFGTGLNQAVTGEYAASINRINQLQTHVLSVDIPSGLNGTTGQIEGVAVKATQTISILAANTGLFTLDGKDCCGEIVFEKLGVQPEVYDAVPQTAQLSDASLLASIKASRCNNSHKGQFGHVLTVGGQAGMMGAVLLAAQAVLKSGAGLTTVVTDPKHADLLPLYAPELMTQGFDELEQHQLVSPLSTRPADVLLIGMGLGQSQWSKQLFKKSVQSNIPLVIDADGLTLLAGAVVVPRTLKVITPHPKEAATLLNTSLNCIQSDRWLAVKRLAQKYQCVAVLKGSGTLISDGINCFCCPYGNANLATAGAGDVLAGLVAGLLAQGFDALSAAHLAVVWHAIVGENNPYGLTMTATNLLNTLQLVVK